MLPYRFELFDSSFHGFYLSSPFFLNSKPEDPDFVPPIPVILDQKGYIAWYMDVPARLNSDFKYFPEYNRYGFIRIKDTEHITYMILDSTLRLMDTLVNTAGVKPDGHELLILANGNYVIGGVKDSIMDLSACTFKGVRGSKKTVAVGYVIQEFDRDHKLVYQWNSNDHLHPCECVPEYEYDSTHFDYCHGNAIESLPDGNFLVSFRNLDAVHKIDRKSGKVLWRLGGLMSDFSFPDGRPFAGQHDIRQHPSGNFTLFVNESTTPDPKRTRAVEFALEGDSVRKLWEYIYDPPFYSPRLGSHQKLEGGARMINYGFNFRPAPSMLLLDASDQIVSRVFFADSVMSYRSGYYQIDTPFPRPEIRISTTADGQDRLEAPEGFGQYVWSSGETSRSIVPQKAGEYQVWVPYGMGMIGSEAVVVGEKKRD
jgi:hypothetical protein